MAKSVGRPKNPEPLLPVEGDPNKYTIIQDTREKIPIIFEESEFCNGTKVKMLKTGDYSIEGLEDYLSVERKATTSEIATNFVDKRFWEEMGRLQKYPYKFLLAEFTMFDVLRFPQGSTIPSYRLKYIRITPQFLFSCLVRLQVQYGVSVIFAESRDQGRLFMTALFKQLHKHRDKIIRGNNLVSYQATGLDDLNFGE